MDVHSVSPRLLLWDNSSFLGPGPNEQPIERSQLARFQVVQEARDRIVVNLEPLSQSGSDIRAQIESRSREIFPEDIAVEVRLVQRIDPEPSQKHRYIRSLDAVGAAAPFPSPKHLVEQ